MAGGGVTMCGGTIPFQQHLLVVLLPLEAMVSKSSIISHRHHHHQITTTATATTTTTTIIVTIINALGVRAKP